MKIQIVARHQAGCDWYRCILPAIYLQKDIEWCKTNSIEMLWIGQDEWKLDCDILIYNKLISTPVSVLKQYQQQGMKIVVDVDDMWILPSWHTKDPQNREGNQWNKSGNAQLTQEHIEMADMVTCTSMRLQEEIRKFNKNTIVIPNAVPFGEGLYTDTNRVSSDKVRFLYAGGVAHLPDVKLLEGKFRKIASEPYIKDNAEFILAGYEKARKSTKEYRSKEDMDKGNENYTIKTEDIVGAYDYMKTIFSHTGSSRVIETLPVNKYISVYDQADVVLAPMVDDPWNHKKSVLKAIEAATRRLPLLCSSVPPYSDLKPCEGVMYVETPEQWLHYIRRCIKEPQWRIDQGQLLYEKMSKDYELTIWNQVRKEMFLSLMR